MSFPHARLNVPIGDPRRGRYLKWLFFAPACIEPAITDRAFPRQEQPRRGTFGYGDFDTVMKVVAKAVEPGPYLMGDQFTAADVVVGSTLRWGMMFDLVPKGPEFVGLCGAGSSSGPPCSGPPLSIGNWRRPSGQQFEALIGLA